MNLVYTVVRVKLLKMLFNVRKACLEIKTKVYCKHVIVTITRNKILKTVTFTPQRILPVILPPT